MAEIGARTTGSGVNDNDTVIQISNALSFDTFNLMSTAGAMDVFVSLDGTNFTTAALSLTDQGASAADPVLVTAANRCYGFRGKYQTVLVRQNGATAVENATMTYGSM